MAVIRPAGCPFKESDCPVEASCNSSGTCHYLCTDFDVYCLLKHDCPGIGEPLCIEEKKKNEKKDTPVPPGPGI